MRLTVTLLPPSLLYLVICLVVDDEGRQVNRKGIHENRADHVGGKVRGTSYEGNRTLSADR